MITAGWIAIGILAIVVAVLGLGLYSVIWAGRQAGKELFDNDD